MSWTGETFRRAVPILNAMPDDTFFSVSDDGLTFQATTQAEVAQVKAYFPGAIWQHMYTDYPLCWWEYACEHEGLSVRIIAVQEAPAGCKAITETHEETVIVGWDCGNHNGGE